MVISRSYLWIATMSAHTCAVVCDFPKQEIT